MKKTTFMQHESVLATENGVSENLKDLTWYDKSVPCRTACPADTDIPGYLEAIYQKDFDKAYQINLEDNIFPEILGRVCSRPCEDACRHGDDNNGNSLAICFSKRAAGDYKSKNKKYKVKKLSQSTKKSIAIIGAGVAGLACARELSRFGHNVHVFEKHKSAGGMLNQGIPIFRLPRNVIKREIDQIIDMGVNITYNQEISSYEDLQKLSKKFDAVVLAMGTLKPNKIDKSFTCNEFVEDGLDFLLRINEFNSKKVGQNVVVIGGGDTGSDCIGTSIRQGAVSVTQLEIMPAPPMQENKLITWPNWPLRMRTSSSQEEGATREFSVMTQSFEGDNDGNVRMLHCIKVDKGFKPIVGSEFHIKADLVLLAMGFVSPKFDGMLDEIDVSLDSNNNVLANTADYRTSCEKVWVAGDMRRGQSLVVWAIREGRQCARAVDKYLMGDTLLPK